VVAFLSVVIVRHLIRNGDRGSGQNRLLVVFDKAQPLQLREDRTCRVARRLGGDSIYGRQC
jgi:hypothetical protein